MAPGKRRETYLSIFGPLSLFLLFLLWGVILLFSFSALSIPPARAIFGNACT